MPEPAFAGVGDVVLLVRRAARFGKPLGRLFARIVAALAAGALLTFARPWKVISITTIVVALLKSGQMSHLLTAAMSAADYRKDANKPEWK